ncbi:hypothetical protein WA026_001003 [Henosepilachna vigintioctopunctata]|uniref:Uncharacterized protein n=1 Tax=Henosepilachna vigintioctopunctata TaxID=420089 RepID=A0AAW1V5Y3_9CUCU
MTRVIVEFRNSRKYVWNSERGITKNNLPGKIPVCIEYKKKWKMKCSYRYTTSDESERLMNKSDVCILACSVRVELHKKGCITEPVTFGGGSSTVWVVYFPTPAPSSLDTYQVDRECRHVEYCFCRS